MRAFLLLSTICISSAAIAQVPNTLDLMPFPKSMSIQEGRFIMSSGFTVAVKADPKDTTCFLAVNRMFQTLNRRTGLYFHQEIIAPQDYTDTASLIIRVKLKTKMEIGMDESYRIQINSNRIILDAATTIGALRGMQTIIQLLSNDESGFYMPLVNIEDAPKYAWRGLMIDVCRHFIPIEVLKRNLDAMAAVKMNVLHLHLSDDQGFRVESNVFPKLQSQGSNGDYYTQVQIRDLISYAGNLGIIIVPEFDMPGHSTSWFAGYPELATKPGPYKPGSPYKIDRSEPVSPMKLMQTIQSTPFPTFNPIKESVYRFLDAFIGEMSSLFPSPFFHIGADENNGVAWKQDSAIVAFMRKNNIANTHELQAYFVDRVQKLVTKHGKKMIGWDELFSKNLSKDVTVQVWQPMSPPTLVQQIVSQGNPVILSKGLYLDQFMPAYIHYNLELPKEEILGGEAAQWTEVADAENIETRIWPRAAAIAEKFWSPNKVTDPMDLYRRLFVTSGHLSESGLMHISNYDRMVLRFSAGYSYEETKGLMDVLTPVKGYKRLFGFISLPESATYQSAPLIRAADIAWVDPQAKWEFRKKVADYLQTKSKSSEMAIRVQLKEWTASYDQLKPLFESSTLAKEIMQHSKNLSALSTACLQTMDSLNRGSKPTEQWLKEQQALLESAKGTYGEVELAVLPELTALITQQLNPLPASYPLF
jgi:hexosaminidase